MKGDCVFINTYGTIKIIRVTNYMPNGIIGERKSAMHFAEIKDVTPIPITNRFLINNGFLQVGHLYMFCGTNDFYKYKFIIEYNLSTILFLSMMVLYQIPCNTFMNCSISLEFVV